MAQSADFVIMTEKAEMFVTPNTSVKNLAENSACAGTACAVCADDISSVERQKLFLPSFLRIIFLLYQCTNLICLQQ